jgi:thiol-disulfide isomerase/thioredoxin
MRVLRYSAFILSVLASTLLLLGQQARQPDHPEHFYFVALTDPACPVTGYTGPVPVTKEIRVLYYPMGDGATIKKPKSPVVHLVFDDGLAPDSEQTLPFMKRDDDVWVATLALGNKFPRYAVYWIEDRENKQVDTNDGKYFEIPFCNAQGHRHEWSVLYEAESYTGQLEAHGIERAADYSKAIQVLDEYIHAPSRGENLISIRWDYELKLHGDTPEARSALLAEIKKFINDHSVDGFGLVSVLNFAAYQDWFPSDTMESLVKAIENKYPDDNPRAFILQARAMREANEEKRISLLWELVDKYPTSSEADSARKRLLTEVTDLAQREKLYQQLRTRDPSDPRQPLNMASMYVEANQKLPEALALLDEADRLLAARVQDKHAKVHYPESTLRDMRLRMAIMRGDILIRLGKPSEAVSVLQPIKDQFTSGSPYYLLGKAFEETANKRAAIDAYLESVVRPSNDQQRANAALEALWSSEKLGSEQDLQQRIEAQLAQNFSSANYVPRVLGHPAPDFDLITLNGERLSNSKLRGKKVILDFWAVWCGPCRWELKPLQDFQEKHPEVVVATVVDESTDAKQLEKLIRDKELTSLRISTAPSEVRRRFNKGGVPDTFVIDENGFVRIEHLGAVPDVTRYLEADLKAIVDAGPAKEVGHTAPQ